MSGHDPSGWLASIAEIFEDLRLNWTAIGALAAIQYRADVRFTTDADALTERHPDLVARLRAARWASCCPSSPTSRRCWRAPSTTCSPWRPGGHAIAATSAQSSPPALPSMTTTPSLGGGVGAREPLGGGADVAAVMSPVAGHPPRRRALCELTFPISSRGWTRSRSPGAASVTSSARSR